MHQAIIPPLKLRIYDIVEPNRVVLYREDYRPIITLDKGNGTAMKHVFYIVEISRSKYKMQILAIKIQNSKIEGVI
jgi:hypothetical protein